MFVLELEFKGIVQFLKLFKVVKEMSILIKLKKNLVN